jgi:hypothetical protein
VVKEGIVAVLRRVRCKCGKNPADATSFYDIKCLIIDDKFGRDDRLEG